MVGRSLSLVRRRATQCQNVYATLPTVLRLSAVFLKHFSSQSTNVYSALEALARVRYINRCLTLHYESVFSYPSTLTTWYCPNSPATAAAIDQYLLPTGHTAANLLQWVWRICRCGTGRRKDRQMDRHRIVSQTLLCILCR